MRSDYNGKSCDQVKDWCRVEPCLNGGTCLPQGPVGYKCQCKPGYSGVNCQIAADPCASNPCRGQATCRSTVAEYICQCLQGKEWTGSVCRDTTNDYTLLVNSYEGQDVPSLRTSFRLNTTSFSIMMRVKTHDVNIHNPIATLFSVIATPDLKPKVDLLYNDYDFIVSVNKSAYVAKLRGGTWTQHPLDENFGGNIHDGEWHILGIAVNNSGYMTVTIDQLSSDPVSLGKSLSLASNGQIFLGYGYIAEFQNVTIWDKYLTTNQIAQAYVNQLQTGWTPVQGFWNYRIPASSVRMTQKLNRTLKARTVLEAPMMDCDEAEDVHYPTKDRLTQLENITEVIQTYESITSDLPSGVQKQHSFPSTLTWGYYTGIIIAKNMTTTNYAECRLSLYIRRNDVCPAVVTDATVSLTNCTAPALGYCDITCTGTGTALAAPTPNYIICGSLGVYDYRTPMDNFIMPSCTASSNPVYVYSVSMQYQFSINCGSVNVGVNKQKLKDAVTTSFKTSLSSKWLSFCDDANCINLVVQDPVCVSTTADHIVCSGTSGDCLKRVMVTFSLTLKTETATAVGGATMPVEDALRIIVQMEQDRSHHLENIASAALVKDSPVFTMVTQCPVNSGRSLKMVNGVTKCVPCSKGWYYDSTTMQCAVCGRGTYQDLEGSTSCKPCAQNTTTAQKGARASTDCKDQNFNTPSSDSPEKGVIVGSVIGAVGVIACCVFVYFLVRKARRSRIPNKKPSVKDEDEDETYDSIDSESTLEPVAPPCLPESMADAGLTSTNLIPLSPLKKPATESFGQESKRLDSTNNTQEPQNSNTGIDNNGYDTNDGYEEPTTTISMKKEQAEIRYEKVGLVPRQDHEYITLHQSYEKLDTGAMKEQPEYSCL